MIRWYDYLAAVIVADLILGSVITAMSSESVWMTVFGGIAVFVFWDLWNVYCNWRKNNES